jgi:hypothetical protein
LSADSANKLFIPTIPSSAILSDDDLLTRNRITGEIRIITGATGSFTTSDSKTVTVTNGIITSII